MALSQLRVENKEVTCHSVPDQIPKCLIFLLNLYVYKIPKYTFKKHFLYPRPKPTAPVGPDTPQWEEAPVGKNTQSAMVKETSIEAEIEVKQITAYKQQE